MRLLRLARNDISFILPITIALCLLFSMVSISASQILLSLSLLCWMILLLLKKEKLCFPPFFWPLLAYCILSLVSSFLSFNPEESLWDCRELLLYLIVPIVYLGFHREKELKIANLALLISAYLSALYSFFYFFLKASPGERIAGFMGHYMTQAGLLLLFSCLAMSMFLFSKDKIRLLWGLAFLMTLGSLVLTLTRSAWMGIVIAAIVILFLYKPKALIIVPLAVGLFFLVSPKQATKRALSIFSLKTATNQQRIEYIKGGIKVIKEYPLFGTGPNMINVEIKKEKYGLSDESKKLAVHLHNNIIQIAAERGIPTILAWLIFMAWVFISLVKLLQNKDPFLFPLTVAALAAFLGFLTAGLFEYNFGDSEVTTLFLYLITIPFTLERIQKRQHPDLEKS